MASANVSTLRRILEAFNARDINALTAHAARDLELRSVFAGEVGGTLYRGHSGLHSWLHDLEDAWGDTIRVESEKDFDLGETTLSFSIARMHGRQSGIDMTTSLVIVASWRDGLCTCLKMYLDRESAFNELGVSEAALAELDLAHPGSS